MLKRNGGHGPTLKRVHRDSAVRLFVCDSARAIWTVGYIVPNPQDLRERVLWSLRLFLSLPHGRPLDVGDASPLAALGSSLRVHASGASRRSHGGAGLAVAFRSSLGLDRGRCQGAHEARFGPTGTYGGEGNPIACRNPPLWTSEVNASRSVSRCRCWLPRLP